MQKKENKNKSSTGQFFCSQSPLIASSQPVNSGLYVKFVTLNLNQLTRRTTGCKWKVYLFEAVWRSEWRTGSDGMSGCGPDRADRWNPVGTEASVVGCRPPLHIACDRGRWQDLNSWHTFGWGKSDKRLVALLFVWMRMAQHDHTNV